jgi:hypothetical protein
VLQKGGKTQAGSISSPPKLADLGWLGSKDPGQLQVFQKLQEYEGKGKN